MPRLVADVLRRRRHPSRRVIAAFTALGIALLPGLSGRAGDAEGVQLYSTAAPPADYLGPIPVLLARADDGETTTEPTRPAPREPAPAEPAPASPGAPARGVTRLANASTADSVLGRTLPEPEIAAQPKPAAEDPIVRAKRMIGEARQRFSQVRDYSCTFFKRERISGRMTPQYVMQMKARTRPQSIYFRFVRPNSGREAIYVAGRNGGRAIVHDVGLGKLLAGTVELDPRSDRAMEDNRHPITEAGLGHLIETVFRRWNAEMNSGETRVTIVPNTRVGDRLCTMVESMHPQRHPSYLFHKVKLYFDHEHGLPIRFEAYDWPRRPGGQAELVEEYTYHSLRLNPGLSEHDFDPSNPQYSFGRF
jgi:hypothetical protein